MAADPQIVATMFAEKYYNVLLKSPNLAYKFYDDSSVVSWPQGSDGKVVIVTTMQRIKSLIMSHHFEDCQVNIETIDGQASTSRILAGGGGVVVVVSGTWKGKEAAKRFTQIFFLAPRRGQEGDYYVLNDIFKFVDEPVDLTPSSDWVLVESEFLSSSEVEEEVLGPQAVVEQDFFQFKFPNLRRRRRIGREETRKSNVLKLNEDRSIDGERSDVLKFFRSFAQELSKICQQI